MCAVAQRVKRASVSVDGEPVSWIGPGLLVLPGNTHDDDQVAAEKLSGQLLAQRIFNDADGKMNVPLS